jgi:hypothetical protein
MSDSTSATFLCDQFVDLVPVSGASITVFRRPGAQSTICVSDGMAVELDQLQFDLGEGPRWETARTGQASVGIDVRGGQNSSWPVFGAAAAQLGVGAVFSFPLRRGIHLLGVADLYRREVGPLGDAATARAVALARRIAGPAAAEARRSAESEDEVETRDAPALRREVHQATGMILSQLGVDAEEALVRLRAHAFDTGRTVEEISRDVVTRQLDFRSIP